MNEANTFKKKVVVKLLFKKPGPLQVNGIMCQYEPSGHFDCLGCDDVTPAHAHWSQDCGSVLC